MCTQINSMFTPKSWLSRSLITSVHCVLLCLVFGVSSLALAGRDSGGGNSKPSEGKPSVSEIEKIVKASWGNLSMVLYRTAYDGKVYPKNLIADAVSEIALRKFTKFFSEQKIKDVSENVLVTSTLYPCSVKEPQFVGDDLKRDSSMNIDVRGVCVSTSRLSDRLASETVSAEIVSLLVHEVSHLGGASEQEAYALQKWILRKIELTRMIGTSAGGLLYNEGSAWAAYLLGYLQNMKNALMKPSCKNLLEVIEKQFDTTVLERMTAMRPFTLPVAQEKYLKGVSIERNLQKEVRNCSSSNIDRATELVRQLNKEVLKMRQELLEKAYPIPGIFSRGVL